MIASGIYTGHVSVAGGELEYDVYAAQEETGRVPVIFLHGWTLDRRMWEPQCTAFADRRVVVLDRRGCGNSSAPFDLSQEPDDVIALADQLGFESFVLVGMSQAGYVAAATAIAHPEKVARLILQGARLGPVAAESEPDIPLNDYRDLAKSGRLTTMKSLWRDHPLMSPADSGKQDAIDAMLERYDGADLLADDQPRQVIRAHALAQLPTPALILTGDQDTPLRRSVARDLGNTLLNAKHIEIEHAGHMCNLCAPAHYNAALQSFLEGH